MRSNSFLTILLLLVFLLILYLFKPFLLSIAIAILMAIATANLHKIILLKVRKKALVATILALAMLFLFFTPLAYASFSFAAALKNVNIEQLQDLLKKTSDFWQNLDFAKPKINEFLNGIDLTNLGKNVLNYASNFTKSGAKFLSELILIIVFYFFANFYGAELVSFLRSLTPLNKKDFQKILSEVSNILSVVFYSIIITAVFEGFLFAICVVNFGYDGILFGILYAISSLIPLIGGALLWLPISLYEYSHSNTANALTIALYSIFTISIIADTFIKPLIIKWINKKLLKTPANINELLVFFAMLAGISSFGFWGVILGPAILALFLSVAKLYILVGKKY